jgi:hypothetical protein
MRTWRLMMGIVLAGCAAEGGGVIEIVSSPVADNVCVVSPNSQIVQNVGSYDPQGPFSYRLDLLLRNNTQLAENDKAETFGDRAIRERQNAIDVYGFDVCWYRADSPQVATIGSHADGLAIDCFELPDNQKAFITTGISVPPNGGLGIATAHVLQDVDLQAPGIFGPDFKPKEIAALTEDPTAETRSANFGNFPFATESRVIVQLRAVGKLQAGSPVESNWFVFPVDVQVGFVDLFCQDIMAPTCAFYITDQSCDPYQGVKIECSDVSKCDTP